MNNKTILATVFLLAGTLLTSTMAMAPVYAERDDDNNKYDDNKKYNDDNKRYDKDGNGNKQKVEDESAGAIADCDKNEVERADFDCFASAATDDSEVNTGDGRDGGMGPGDGVEGCEPCIAAFLEAVLEDDTTPPSEALVTAAISVFGDCEDEFTEEDVEDLARTLNLIPLIDLDAVEALEECLDALLEGTIV
jgi:hypothetical protein